MVLSQDSRVHITITTNVQFYTAVFKRKYNLLVDAIQGDQAVISVTWQDYTPGGYMKGGNGGLILECEELTIPQDGTARQWLAALVLQHHEELNQTTGCQYWNKSMQIIKTTLDGITQV